MASKPVKKKAVVKASAETIAKATIDKSATVAKSVVDKSAAVAKDVAEKASKVAQPLAAKSKSTSVVPFNPLSAITNPDFAKFNKSIPSLGGSFETMETTMNNFKNQYEKISSEASSSVRESVENLSKSSATFAKGAEKIMKTLAEAAQGSSQRNAEAVKALMATRTLNEFAEAQNKLVQQNFEEAMSTMTKLSEMTIKLCSEAMEPINGQMTKAMTSAMSAAKKNAA
jgi:phasin family protein